MPMPAIPRDRWRVLHAPCTAQECSRAVKPAASVNGGQTSVVGGIWPCACTCGVLFTGAYLPAKLDIGNSLGDLPSHEVPSPTRRFMVEEDARTGIHVV